MKRNQYHYARKWRQFRYLSKQVNRALTSGKFQQYSRTKQLQLKKRLEALYLELKGVFSSRKLRKALAGAALILGLSFTTQAQTFDLPQTNPFGIDHQGFFNLPTMVDIDNDGDLDMFAAEYAYYSDGFEMYYYENTGSADNPVFGAAQPTPLGINDTYVSRPTFGDIDNDGDLDMLVGNWGFDYYSGGSGSLRFYENTGTVDSPVFAEPVEMIGGLSISSDYFALVEWIDMDGDGDLDLYTTQDLYGDGVYYENVGTPEAPDYGPAQSDPFGTTAPTQGPRFFDFADIDNDGDLDLLTTVYNFNVYGSELYFQENLGTHVNPDFDEPIPMPFGISAGGPNSGSIVQPFMADIDGDGDQDLFFNAYSEVASIYGDAAFYEQITTTAPVSDDAMITTQLNEAHAFAASEFPFTDADGDNLQVIRILSLPDTGVLELDGIPVVNGQVIPEAQLGLLVFTPEQDEFGNPYASFDFRVSDGDLFNPVTQTMTIEVLETNSVQNQLLNANITLAPNPATDLLRVEATLEDQQRADAQLRILTLTGQVLQQVPVGLFNGSIHTELSVMDLSPGMYLLELNVDGRIRTERFVKQ